jgi:SAM-dependent methyltransferase
MAESWAECPGETPELPFFQQEIARYGQPALDLACGIGRLLIPLLRLGIDVDGCDISADMLLYCRRSAEREGLTPKLYQQPMHALELPRKYKTIFICNAFDLAGSRANDLETLRRCHAHLDQGGALLFNILAEYTSPESWDGWLSERRRDLPQPWPEQGSRRTAPDGSEYVTRVRLVDMNPLEQCLTRQVRIEKWQSGKLAATEEYAMHANMYLKSELLLMLNVAGFKDVSVRGDYTEQPATPESRELAFLAVR